MTNLFHDGIEYPLTKLGHADLELKKAQYDSIGQYAWRTAMY